MKQLITLQLTLTMLLSSSCYAAGKLFIKNESNWKIQINYKKGKTQLARLIMPQETTNLGPIGSLTDATYQTYGQVYGLLAKTHPIDLTEGKRKQKTYETIITISTYLQRFTIKYEYQTEAPIKTEVPASYDPWDIFPNAKVLIEQGYKKNDERVARYILGLGSRYSKNDIEQSARMLSTEWHPDKHREAKEFATEVQKIINNAREVLEGTLAR